MYKVYLKQKYYKRAYSAGFETDDFNKAKEVADRGANGYILYEWVKVKDMATKKYVYTAERKEEN